MNLLPTECGLLLAELSRRAAAVKQPASGAFELTSRCNLRCGMCYIRPLIGDTRPSEELSATEWVSLAREAVASGLVFLLLTGGEPLLRPDFFEIYDPISELGLHLTLFTNGTLVTKEIANRLAGRPPHRLEITLYGASASTYEAITGVQGSHARCLSGIENLRSAGVRFSLKTGLNRRNLDELESMRAMADEWGLSLGTSWLTTPRRDRRGFGIEDYRLTPDEVVLLEIADRKKHPSAQPYTSAPNRTGLSCDAGSSSFVITSNGEMNICMDLPRPAARPQQVGFAEAWKRVNQSADALSLGSNCRACELEPLCPTCPGFAYLECGEVTAPVPYLCEVAKQRQKAGV